MGGSLRVDRGFSKTYLQEGVKKGLYGIPLSCLPSLCLGPSRGADVRSEFVLASRLLKA